MRALLFSVLLAVGCSAEEEDIPAVLAGFTTADGLYEVSFPEEVGPFEASTLYTVRFEVREQGELSPVSVVVDPMMPDHGHGMAEMPVVDELSDGVFETELTYTMPGKWELTFEVDGAAGADAGAVLVEVL